MAERAGERRILEINSVELGNSFWGVLLGIKVTLERNLILKNYRRIQKVLQISYIIILPFKCSLGDDIK